MRWFVSVVMVALWLAVVPLAAADAPEADCVLLYPGGSISGGAKTFSGGVFDRVYWGFDSTACEPGSVLRLYVDGSYGYDDALCSVGSYWACGGAVDCGSFT